MTTQTLEKLKYPIGEFQAPETIKQSQIGAWISSIENFPYEVEKLVEKLTEEELDFPYRPDGWTIKQVVHHCGDSHMNAIIRFKLALTEDSPTIRPYLEAKWAELDDSQDNDLELSLNLLKGLHGRWVRLLKSLNTEDLEREFIHPEHNKRFSLKETIGTYAWHSNHHLAHIKQALTYRGKF